MIDFEKLIRSKKERKISEMRKKALMLMIIIILISIGYFKFFPTGYSIRKAILEQDERFCKHDLYCMELLNLSHICNSYTEECIYLLALLRDDKNICNELLNKSLRILCMSETND